MTGNESKAVVAGLVVGLLVGLFVGSWAQSLASRNWHRKKAVEQGVAEYTVDNEGNVSWDWKD